MFFLLDNYFNNINVTPKSRTFFYALALSEFTQRNRLCFTETFGSIAMIHFKRCLWCPKQNKPIYTDTSIHISWLNGHNKYQLLSAIIYNGNGNTGHYSVYIKTQNKLWVYVSDCNVKRDVPDEVAMKDISKHCHILFYCNYKAHSNLPVKPLVNIGSSCFINAAVQAIMHTIYDA